MPDGVVEIGSGTDVYERRYGRWQAVWSQATRIRPPTQGPTSRGYFAYSTARVSRMTVTLIWPG